MTMQKIEFEYEIPDGYRFVRFGKRKKKDLFIGSDGSIKISDINGVLDYWLIVEKIPEQVQPTQNTKRHKHADSIHAWAEGAIIQLAFPPSDIWIDCPDNSPAWNVDRNYRIKPAVKKVTFRNWLTKSGRIAAWNLIEGDSAENCNEFKCWIGDWQSVEVEE